MDLNFFLEFETATIESIKPDKIRFTSSITNQTSTLTLTFSNNKLLKKTNLFCESKKLIKGIYFIYENSKFLTKDIKIIWINGRPIFFEAIFLITSETESIKLQKFFNSLAGKNLLN